MRNIDAAATYLRAFSARARKVRDALRPGSPARGRIAAVLDDFSAVRAGLRLHGARVELGRVGLAGRLREGPATLPGLTTSLRRFRAYARLQQVEDRDPARRVFWRSAGDAAALGDRLLWEVL